MNPHLDPKHPIVISLAVRSPYPETPVKNQYDVLGSDPKTHVIHDADHEDSSSRFPS